jgi:hypothetical protein
LVLFPYSIFGYFVEDNFVQGITYPHPDYSLGPLNIQGSVGYHDWRQHQGWRLVRAGQWETPDNYWSRLNPPAIWQKFTPAYILTMEYFKDKGGYRGQYRYSIRENDDAHEIKLAKVRWADIDQRGRVVLARDGKLFTATITDKGELTLTELADFNASKPEQVQTPAWAKRW